jgi:hypothetical protein
MNHEELIHRFLEGSASPGEAAVLSHLIETDASVRVRYLEFAELHASLIADETLRDPEAPKSPAPFNKDRWNTLRPLAAAAAAGLVIGLFGASLVFGYVMPKAVTKTSRLFELMDGSFENMLGRLPTGFPAEFGAWSGDASEVVEKGDAQPRDGKRVLRFLKAEREAFLPNYGAASCDVYQLVDLRSIRMEATAGEATLELSVQFRDLRETPGEPVRLMCRVYVFSGLPKSLPAEWPMNQKEALASGCGFLDSRGGSPAKWQEVTTRALLPARASFAVVHLVAHKPEFPRGGEAAFGEQFADDVRLTLKTQPALPERSGPH